MSQRSNRNSQLRSTSSRVPNNHRLGMCLVLFFCALFALGYTAGRMWVLANLAVENQLAQAKGKLAQDKPENASSFLRGEGAKAAELWNNQMSSVVDGDEFANMLMEMLSTCKLEINHYCRFYKTPFIHPCLKRNSGKLSDVCHEVVCRISAEDLWFGTTKEYDYMKFAQQNDAQDEDDMGEGGMSCGLLHKLVCWLRPEQGVEVESGGNGRVLMWKDSSRTEPKYDFDSFLGEDLIRKKNDYKSEFARAAGKAQNPRWKEETPLDHILDVQMGPTLHDLGSFKAIRFPCGMVAHNLALRDQMTLFFVLAPGFLEREHVGMEPNYYQILGVSRTSDSLEIKRAYKAKTFELHPDKNPSPTAEDEFNTVKQAYRVLMDMEQREVYNKRFDEEYQSQGVGQRFFGHYPNGQLLFDGARISIKTHRGDLTREADDQILENHFVIASYRFNERVEISVNGQRYGLDHDSGR